MSETATMSNAEHARYRVTGMDCPSCAAKIEKAVRSAGVEDVKVSTATQIMTVHVSDLSLQLPEVERAVSGIGYRLDRLGGPEAALLKLTPLSNGQIAQADEAVSSARRRLRQELVLDWNPD